MTKQFIDHIDIVTSHLCNRRCPYCIDKFLGKSHQVIDITTVDKFLKLIRKHTDDKLEVLLLGGEPTILPIKTLQEISKIIMDNGFIPIMSTNGLLRNKIIQLLPYYRWIQVTINCDADIEYYRSYKDKINIKMAGDEKLTKKTLEHFVEQTKDFPRKSISMYFTGDYEELCKDEQVWSLLNTLEWERNGSYLYAFYKGVRIKRCITGQTNIVDEPSVPKLYPNGNYNKTWCHEEMDDYLDI